MPKKFTGENSKAAAARDRKEAQKADAGTTSSWCAPSSPTTMHLAYTAAKSAKAKDDAYWDEAEGKKSKASIKKQEEARKRDEAAARKAENKRLAAEEEASMATPKSAGKLGKVGAPGPKVTHHELRLQADAERRELETQVDKRKAAARREVSEEDYARMVDVENTNRMDDRVDARSMNEALAALTVDDKEVDRHPERYVPV